MLVQNVECSVLRAKTFRIVSPNQTKCDTWQNFSNPSKEFVLAISFVFDLSRGTLAERANPVRARAGRWRQKRGKRYFCRPQNIFPAKFCVSWEYFLASPIAHNSIHENDAAEASIEAKSPAIDCLTERKNWIRERPEFPHPFPMTNEFPRYLRVSNCFWLMSNPTKFQYWP